MKKILVVDDQSSIRRLVEMTLADDGIEVAHADSGEAALEQARELSPDLVIMDVMMPGGMDGYETIVALRERSCSCPVLMLTAKDQNGEQIRSSQAGVDAYLAKPFRLQDLVAAVEALLGRTSEG